MSKFSVAAKRFGGFMKRNAFYFLIILCIASVATVIALAVTYNNGAAPDTGLNTGDDTPVLNPDDNKPVDPTPETPVKKLTFISPCNGTISSEYDTSLVMNTTMSQWETHSALDFVSDDLNVYAAADGTVKEVGCNDLYGNYIVLQHEDGYTTKYMSLDALDGIVKGASVKQGQLVGKMSDTQGTEALKGAHLHFELHKDDKPINPLEVIVLDEK
ncbi:MAG: M23 family metallopeptidase [Bacteroides sp.]|nr:M23 family metallopeptidase [Bacillota bacterium]MCM1394017.1 M23 family metallopeptidase [[Eubacterium] siraeum]MCM1455772.1 M23 family metallopeptidase [Bacteroides sp.]